MKNKKFDFGGYATKYGIKCADGRTIGSDAFAHLDGATVPLVWQHDHDCPGNVLGHALLEKKGDGIYAYGYFNTTEEGQHAKELVKHGDITNLSIFANHLKQTGNLVIHGEIRELSLVLAGANPGALIDNVNLMHGDGVDDTEAIIYTDEDIYHSIDGEPGTEEEEPDEELEHSDETAADIFNAMDDKQKQVVLYMLEQAVTNKLEHSDLEGDEEMKKNIFDQKGGNANQPTLSHADVQSIVTNAAKCGSLKEAVLAHAAQYGIEDPSVLFPDAKMARGMEWKPRDNEWVAEILSGTSKTPFSRIKSGFFDMDIATARAKGYKKATEKKEVYFKAAKRVTTPCTVYVKQKLDRDDIIDITDLSIVDAAKHQLRVLLNEELAQAILFGDGRETMDADKISEDCIRPIWKDDDLFTVKEKIANKTDYKAIIKEIALSHKRYKGSGAPVLFMTPDLHANMLWVEDNNGRRIYESDASLCAALRVSKIVEIPQMESLQRKDDAQNTYDLMALKVNLRDYSNGADKGGQVSTFDDFDIDFNQYKYLMETRCSGALTKLMSAQAYEFVTPHSQLSTLSSRSAKDAE